MSHSEVLNIQIAKTVSHVEIVHHVPQCTPKQNALSHLDDMQKFEIYKNVFLYLHWPKLKLVIPSLHIARKNLINIIHTHQMPFLL